MSLLSLIWLWWYIYLWLSYLVHYCFCFSFHVHLPIYIWIVLWSCNVPRLGYLLKSYLRIWICTLSSLWYFQLIFFFFTSTWRFIIVAFKNRGFFGVVCSSCVIFRFFQFVHIDFISKQKLRDTSFCKQ